MDNLQIGPGYTVSGGEAAREQHHVRLNNAVGGMREVTIQLRLLLDRIQNGNSDHPDKTAQPSDPREVPIMPPLSAVLQSAPNDILKANDEHLCLIEAIRDQLF